MGYYSTVRESNDPVIIRLPEVVESAEDRKFREEAERRGYSVPVEADRTEELQEILSTHTLGYFLSVVGRRDGYAVESSGESGKAYGFDDNIKAFTEAISALGGSITGVFFLAGEDVGDLKRYRFEGNQVIIDKAQLTFPDGSVYSS